ncbi:insulinase family protein [bacterium]|nr:insulinase family protein [bacterium]
MDLKRLPWIFILLCTVLFSQTTVNDIRSFTLKNGMQFLVVEDHSIPNANMFIFWKVGSRNEVPGITGLSHFFEHMMFNGAEKYGPKEFDRVMEAAGGANNAYTSENVTVYTDFFPSSATELIFDLEADRIGHLALDDQMVESERGVVMSERTMYMENDPWTLLEEQVKGAAFLAHPYRWSVIGYESDIRNWTKQDLQTYFETYYAPNNGLAVMVGDVNLEELRSLAKKTIEPIPSGPAPRAVHTTEPEQLGEKRVIVHKAVSSPRLMIVYHVPETRHPDYYALEMLTEILSGGRSSRLYSSLVDSSQLAVEVRATMPMGFDPGLFYIQAVCKQDIEYLKTEAAIYGEIDRIVRDGVTDRELQKVKNQKLAAFYRRMETIDGKANTLGTYALFFGDYRKLSTAPEAYAQVTPGDIRRVAETYLKKTNRTVGIMLNTGEDS